MALINDRNWSEFCISMRKRMFSAEEFETTVGVDEIHRLSGATISMAEHRKPSFWNACQSGKRNGAGAAKNGIEFSYEVGDDGNVHTVTFRLDDSRRGTLERFIERRLNNQQR